MPPNAETTDTPTAKPTVAKSYTEELAFIERLRELGANSVEMGGVTGIRVTFPIQREAVASGVSIPYIRTSFAASVPVPAPEEELDEPQGVAAPMYTPTTTSGKFNAADYTGYTRRVMPNANR